MQIKYEEVKGKKIAYEILGKGKVDIVIEMGIAAVMGEWHHLAEKMAGKHTVLLYERLGYNLSEMSEEERTPRNIANELKVLLSLLGHEEKIIFIAHSQGGLYIQQFCRLYPEMVKGCILLDPLSAKDNDFKKLLSKEEYKKSGVDKCANFKLMLFMSKLHLGFIIKKLMKSAAPFYYYDSFSAEEEEYILMALTKSNLYETAIAEYECAHNEEYLAELKDKNSFPDVPLVLITHSSTALVKEIMEFGRATKETAEKVEGIWQKLMKEYLRYSKASKYIEAKKSNHFIHLTEPELIFEAINYMENKNYQ